MHLSWDQAVALAAIVAVTIFGLLVLAKVGG